MSYELEVEPFEFEMEQAAPAAASELTADLFYLNVAGTRSGKFPATPILSFSQEVRSPRDIATGQASGKRQHQPLRLLIPWGPGSLLLFHAAVLNEELSISVDMERAGGETVRDVIQLQKAFVVSLRQFGEPADGGVKLVSKAEVSFNFRKLSFKLAGVEVMDN